MFRRRGHPLVRGLDEEEKHERKVSDLVLIRRLLTYLSPFRLQILFSVAVILLTTVTNLVGPVIQRVIIDSYIVNTALPLQERLRGTVTWALAYLGVQLLNGLSSREQSIRVNEVGLRLIWRLREELFRHLQRLSLRFFAEGETGRIMSRVTNDVDSIQELLVSGLVTLISDLATVLGILVVMFSLSVQLSLVALLVVPLISCAILLFRGRIRKAYLESRKKIAGVYSRLQEGISGIRVTQSFTRESQNLQLFGQANVENLEANVRAARITALFSPVIEVIGALGTSLVLWYGGVQIMNGAASIGVVVAFMAYIRMFFRPLMSLSQLSTIYESAMTGMERVFEILDMPVEVEEAEEPVPIPRIEGQVEFQNVTFGYDERMPVLKNINLKVRARETLAIVGPTGAGKSTMVNLVCRFYDPQEGRILIDGHDLRSVSLSSLRRQMGIVLQDPFLFGTTVRENIRYGRLDATDEEVEAAAKVVGAHDFILRLPEGYETVVAEGASNLSVGQKQLISFARVVLADPRILILDEATSSVDPYTELVIQRALEGLVESRTTFIIAHRLSTVRRVDRIIVVDGGEIVEQGSHEELMARGGLYSRLYKMQFRDTEAEGKAAPPAEQRNPPRRNRM